jgi:methyltransferase (TIGR00027 family)
MRDDRPSATAELVCSWRALEALLPAGQRILRDVYARGFVGGARARLLDALARLPPASLLRLARGVDRALQGVMTFVVARQRAIDDLIAEGRWEQVVILGAGYDSRRVRLREALGQATVYEVDHPATAARKARLAERVFAAAESAAAVFVRVDFARESLRERLLSAGFQPGRRTVWAWEGVTMYLDEASVRATLDLVHALSGPQSLLAMDVWCPPEGWVGRFVQGTLPAQAFRWLYQEPLIFGWPQRRLAELLRGHGLSLRESVPAFTLVQRYAHRPRGRLELGTSMVLVVAECGSE